MDEQWTADLVNCRPQFHIIITRDNVIVKENNVAVISNRHALIRENLTEMDISIYKDARSSTSHVVHGIIQFSVERTQPRRSVGILL